MAQRVKNFKRWPKTGRPPCKLVGTDGNVFALAGKVTEALERAGLGKEARDFGKRLWTCEDYHAALRLMNEYVEVR